MIRITPGGAPQRLTRRFHRERMSEGECDPVDGTRQRSPARAQINPSEPSQPGLGFRPNLHRSGTKLGGLMRFVSIRPRQPTLSPRPGTNHDAGGASINDEFI